MRFSDQLLDEIRARIRVSEVVGRKVALRRKGREFAGLSPFGKEKTPSFFVNDEKQFYHCFSSGKHGDIFTWLMEMEGLSFPEAVERLAAEAGVALPKGTREDAERERKRAGLAEVMEMADAFFRARLEARDAAAARAYLERRGLSAATIEAFGLGYAPADRQALRGHLAARGVTDRQMAEAGLVIHGPDIAEPFDRFRDRITFPIGDARGRTIAFGGRALASDAQAKYLNSPDTPLFHKGRVVYNFARARKPAFEAQALLVAEGYMDVIALTQAGFPHAVAPLGTALTEEQIALLWRLAPEPVLCFDGDRAGQAAAYRAVDRVLPILKPGHSVRFAFLPEGKDPDDLIRTEGPDAMRDIVARAQPLYRVVWEREVASRRLDTPERRAAFQSAVRQLARSVRDETVREHYVRVFEEQLATLLGGGPAAARGGMRRRSAGGGGRSGRGAGTGAPPRRFDPGGASPALKRSALARGSAVGPRRSQALLVLAALNHPWLAEAHLEVLSGVSLGDPSLDSLLNEIIHVAAQGEALERDAMRAHLESHGFGHVVRALMSDPALNTVAFCRSEADPAVAEIGFRDSLHECAAEGLRADLARAEADFAADPSEENSMRIVQIRRAMLGETEVGAGGSGG